LIVTFNGAGPPKINTFVAMINGEREYLYLEYECYNHPCRHSIYLSSNSFLFRKKIKIKIIFK